MANVYYLFSHLADGDMDISFSPKATGISDEDYFEYFYPRPCKVPEGAIFQFSAGGTDPDVVERSDVLPCSAGFLLSVRLFDALQPLIGHEVVARKALFTITPDRVIEYRIIGPTREIAILDADAERFHTCINARVRADLTDDFNVATDLATREIIFSQRVADLIEAGDYRCALKKLRPAATYR